MEYKGFRQTETASFGCFDEAPILPEAHAELEPSCNKHVCIEDNKENHVRQPIFQIAGGPHITKVTKNFSEWKQAHV